VKRLALITFILGTALAIASTASAVVLSDGASSRPSAVPSVGVDPATQATLLRSEELAKYYGNPATRAVELRSVELGMYYGIPATRAVQLRSEELAKYYGASSASDVRDGFPAAGAGDSFAWGMAAIGAGTLTGLMLLAIGFVSVTRRRHQPSF
jgi:hypothetical protein